MSLPPLTASHASPPPAVYTTLKEFFQAYALHPVELELLPSAYPLSDPTTPILQDGTSLAIRKRDLVPAFMYARSILFAHLESDTGFVYGTTQEKVAVGDDTVRDATSIILFFDPEHLTAANWRKRELQRQAYLSSTVSRGAATDTDDVPALLSRELNFLYSLLTSPLHRHTKSPTLWHHRLWVFTTYSHMLVGEGPKQKRQIWAEENEIVLKAAERHFANYYAFNYLRRVAAMLDKDILKDEKTLNRLEKWCFLHPRDPSAWAYLVWLLDRGGEGLWDKKRVVLKAVREFRERFDWKGEGVEWAGKALERDMSEEEHGFRASQQEHCD